MADDVPRAWFDAADKARNAMLRDDPNDQIGALIAAIAAVAPLIRADERRQMAQSLEGIALAKALRLEMANDVARCEPSKGRREVDGWHWVQLGDDAPEIAKWISGEGGSICGWWLCGNATARSQHWVETDEGELMRYLGPCATPAEVGALRAERDVARTAAAVARGEVAINEKVVTTLRARVAGLEATLRDARLQLEYMDERSPSGTTPTMIVRIGAALKGAKP